MTVPGDSPEPRLSMETLPRLPAHVKRPAYDRSALTPGIVHIGPGAFHRAHQAVYTDDALAAQGGDWGIVAVSLHSASLRDALQPQDNLYTLALPGDPLSCRIIGAVTETLVAPEDPQEVFNRLTREAIRIVTLTITEKGYCLTPDGDLDKEHEDIRHDLATPHAPLSAIGYLVESLRRRHAAGLMPYTILSCDNLPDNGTRLRRAVTQYAETLDGDLARWIADAAAFPCTMVDSITPATDEALRDRVAACLGVRDAWPVRRETFSQWVIEDIIPGPIPAWAEAGVTFSNEVEKYETVKLRILNGSHSALAYLGLLLGHETVAGAMADPAMQRYIRKLIEEEISPVLTPPARLDIGAYGRSIMARFADPAIEHRLSQIAWDGSQKLPIRQFPTIKANLAAGRPVTLLSLAVAAWIIFIRRAGEADAPVTDPHRDKLLDIARRCDGDAGRDVRRFLDFTPVFPRHLAQNPGFMRALTVAYRALNENAGAALARSVQQTT